jgi:hypothetical protein
VYNGPLEANARIANIATVISSRPLWDNTYHAFTMLGESQYINRIAAGSKPGFGNQLEMQNTYLEVVNGVEDPNTGNAIFLFKSMVASQFYYIAVCVNLYCEVVWQRKISFELVKVDDAGVVVATDSPASLNPLYFGEARLSWQTDDSYRIALTLDGGYGTTFAAAGLGGEMKFSASFPMDGSLKNLDALAKFRDYNNYQYFVRVSYTPSTEVMASVSETYSTTNSFTNDTTDPFTTTNLTTLAATTPSTAVQNGVIR